MSYVREKFTLLKAIPKRGPSNIRAKLATQTGVSQYLSSSIL